MDGILEVALLAFGAFALLYPKSPFTLALLRQRGPRRDHGVLLRSEIRESAKGFATYAIAAFAGAAVIHLAVRSAGPRPDAENAPFYVALLTCAGRGHVARVAGGPRLARRRVAQRRTRGRDPACTHRAYERRTGRRAAHEPARPARNLDSGCARRTAGGRRAASRRSRRRLGARPRSRRRARRRGDDLLDARPPRRDARHRRARAGVRDRHRAGGAGAAAGSSGVAAEVGGARASERRSRQVSRAPTDWR